MTSPKKNLGGRPSGSKSVDSIVYQEFFVKGKIVVPQLEIWALKEARKQYEYYRDNVHSGRYSPMEDNAVKYLKVYTDLLKEIASRLYPKLSSIQQNVVGGVEGFKIIVEDYTKKE